MISNRLLSRREAKTLDLHERIKLEMEITDRETEKARLKEISSNWKFSKYSQRSPWRRHQFEFLGDLRGKVILDVGCGCNLTPTYFALAGAQKVYACDVSPKAVNYNFEAAKKYAVDNKEIGPEGFEGVLQGPHPRPLTDRKRQSQVLSEHVGGQHVVSVGPMV